MAVDQRKRQAHHVEVTAVDFLDKFRSSALDGVGAGFIHGLAAGDVVFDFGIGERGEADLRRRVIDDHTAVVQKADTGDDGVVASGEQVQHASGVFGVCWFFENVVIDYYRGVGAEYDFTGAFPGGFGFGAGEAADVRYGIFSHSANFFDGFCAHGEVESGYG